MLCIWLADVPNAEKLCFLCFDSPISPQNNFFFKYTFFSQLFFFFQGDIKIPEQSEDCGLSCARGKTAGAWVCNSYFVLMHYIQSPNFAKTSFFFIQITAVLSLFQIKF